MAVSIEVPINAWILPSFSGQWEHKREVHHLHSRPHTETASVFPGLDIPMSVFHRIRVTEGHPYAWCMSPRSIPKIHPLLSNRINIVCRSNSSESRKGYSCLERHALNVVGFRTVCALALELFSELKHIPDSCMPWDPDDLHWSSCLPKVILKRPRIKVNVSSSTSKNPWFHSSWITDKNFGYSVTATNKLGLLFCHQRRKRLFYICVIVHSEQLLWNDCSVIHTAPNTEADVAEKTSEA